MEWWIVAGVVIVLAAAGVAARLRRSRRLSHSNKDGESSGSIYPLW